MHQIVLTMQGAEGTTLADLAGALDLVKARILARHDGGTVLRGDLGIEFEVRDVDADHAATHLLAAPKIPISPQRPSGQYSM